MPKPGTTLKKIRETIDVYPLISLNQLQAQLRIPKATILTLVLQANPETAIFSTPKIIKNHPRPLEELFIFTVDAKNAFANHLPDL